MSDGPPFVSIIVPVYNGERTIVPCVQSLIGQDYPPASREIIVVDNASKDGTRSVLDEFVRAGQIRLLTETSILNAYGARNTGARAAAGEVLAFTDADCVAKSDWLTRLLAGHSDSSVGIFIGDILALDPRTAFERYYSDRALSLRHKDLSKFTGMRAGNCAIRRSCFDELGGFRTNTNSGGDSEFLKRALSGTSYRHRIELDAIVRHKNYDNLWALFKRGLRFGASMDLAKNDPILDGIYVPWTRNLRYAVENFIAIPIRTAHYPLVRGGRPYRGREISDAWVFLVEPVIRFTESVGCLMGRTLRWRLFR